MGCSHKKILNIIIFNGLHSLDSFSSTVLGTEIVTAHSFNISLMGHSNDGVFYRNKVFHRDVKLIKSDLCSSFITVFVTDGNDFLFDHSQKQFTVSQNRLIICNFFHQLIIFIFQFFPFQTGQCTKTHIYNCLRLYIIQFKTLDQTLFGNGCTLGSTDDLYHLINVIQSNQ